MVSWGHSWSLPHGGIQAGSRSPRDRSTQAQAMWENPKDMIDPLTTSSSDSIHLSWYLSFSLILGIISSWKIFLLPSSSGTSYPSLKSSAHFYLFLVKQQCILQCTCFKKKKNHLFWLWFLQPMNCIHKQELFRCYWSLELSLQIHIQGC